MHAPEFMSMRSFRLLYGSEARAFILPRALPGSATRSGRCGPGMRGVVRDGTGLGTLWAVHRARRSLADRGAAAAGCVRAGQPDLGGAASDGLRILRGKFEAWAGDILP